MFLSVLGPISKGLTALRLNAGLGTLTTNFIRDTSQTLEELHVYEPNNVVGDDTQYPNLKTLGLPNINFSWDLLDAPNLSHIELIQAMEMTPGFEAFLKKKKSCKNSAFIRAIRSMVYTNAYHAHLKQLTNVRLEFKSKVDIEQLDLSPDILTLSLNTSDEHNVLLPVTIIRGLSNYQHLQHVYLPDCYSPECLEALCHVIPLLPNLETTFISTKYTDGKALTDSEMTMIFSCFQMHPSLHGISITLHSMSRDQLVNIMEPGLISGTNIRTFILTYINDDSSVTLSDACRSYFDVTTDYFFEMDHSRQLILDRIIKD
ncbi:hypothetical protein SAMD00019534_001630 [Acytostelium subglobosum LB1]|uniref:hypothetical protein n=1 Tax=Acytostelium subglobosum LB1 TaxID=1410327 RepID=UPI000644F59D|nr:hypothetical protein SAMD00019534_001630 [Acytostelium subglobosum LB1]GAM16988.1 hypothetical protein SAMD00019534_001630 [Acytostelium subglobosum LB1]|eukprot:XP_012759050.1 hypothetical protein SAMD00019534_001630 [Acytostelium subglobosum LB1]